MTTGKKWLKKIFALSLSAALIGTVGAAAPMNIAGSAAVPASVVEATGITLNLSTLTVNRGDTCYDLYATVQPDTASDMTVIWSSGNENIVTVDEYGAVTAVAVGKTAVYASTTNGKTAACLVTVINPVTDIQLEDVVIHLNGKKKLVPVFTPSDAKSPISWSSTDPSVAYVDEKGYVSALNTGRTTIFAQTDDGPYAECVVTVDSPAKKLTVTPEEKTLFIGKQFKLTSSVVPTASTDMVEYSVQGDDAVLVEPIYKEVEVYDPNTDTYNIIQRFSGCYVTGTAKGEAVITVSTTNGIVCTCNVTVLRGIEALGIEESEVEVVSGESVGLTLSVDPSENDDTVTWTSSNTSIAEVDEDGVVTGYATGTAVIKAKSSSGVYDTCKVIVTKPSTAITLSANTMALEKGKSKKITAALTPSDSTDKVTWTSSNESIVTVSRTGLVTGVAAGSATVTATTTSGLSAEVAVTVKVYPVSVSVAPDSVRLKKGDTQNVTVTLSPDDTSVSTIKWLTTDGTVATAKDGVITAKGVGSATITAKTANGKTATIEVYVYVEPNKIVLNPTEYTLINGRTKKITATVYPTASENKALTWTSSNPAVAEVDQNGLVTSKASGTTTITAETFNGVTASCAVKVVTKPASVTLDESSVKLVKGDSKALVATVLPEGADNKKVTWTSSDKNIATVENGVVTAVNKGTVTITAKTVNGFTAECEVEVIIVPNKIVLNPTEYTLINGRTKKITATVYPTASENKALTWTSSNPAVAEVDQNGLVTSKASGTTTITAETFNGVTASCVVTVVTKPSSITLSESEVTIEVDGMAQLTAEVLPLTADNRSVKWQTSNSNVVTVNNGLIVGIKAGTATITAIAVNGLKATCTVTVIE